jgi:hypothetical protein
MPGPRMLDDVLRRRLAAAVGKLRISDVLPESCLLHTSQNQPDALEG